MMVVRKRYIKDEREGAREIDMKITHFYATFYTKMK
jgi:hypothetical protein